MIQFKLDKKNVQIPSSWDDVSFADYLEVCNGKGSPADFISRATGLTVDQVMNSEITGLEAILAALEFSKTIMKEADQVVTQIGPFKLPLDSKGEYNIQFETLAQFEDLRVMMSKAGKGVEFISKYANYASVYLQKIRDGKYSPDKAKAMVPEIMTYPAPEVISVGSFFFVKLLNLSNGTAKISPSTAPSPKKKKPVLVKSPKSSGRSRPSSKSRKK